MESWKIIYRLGAFSSFLMAAFIPLQIAVFFIWPPPKTALDWFHLFQTNKFIGLLDMDLLLLADQVLMIFILLALYMALRKVSPSLMAIALTLGLVGAASYFASGSAFEMLKLSNMYTAATTQAQKTLAVTGGELMLANWQGTAFNVAYIIQGIALLLIGVVMFQSKILGKVTGQIALVLGILSLVPPTLGTVGMIFALVSVFPLWIWSMLIGRKFLQL